MKKENAFKIYFLPLLIIVVLGGIWSSAGYLKQNSKILPGIMAKYLPFTTSPKVTGGYTAAVIEDDINDVNAKSIPQNLQGRINPDAFDIMFCTVHYPVVNYYDENVWNIDIEVVDLPLDASTPTGFSMIKGCIYIDINDGRNDGSKTAYYNEGIKFDNKNFRWDYFVEFDAYHSNGVMHSFATGREYPVEIRVPKDTKTIRVSVPVVEKIKMKMDKNYMGALFAYLVPYDSFVKSGILRLENAAYLDATPCSINDKNVIDPVAVKESEKTKKRIISDEALDKLKAISESDAPGSSFESDMKEKLNAGTTALRDGKFSEAEKAFVPYRDTPAGLSWLALTTGAKTRDAKGNDEKVSLIHQAAGMFKKAASMNCTDYDRFIVLYNSASLYVNTPDEIFHLADDALKALDELVRMKLDNADRAAVFLKERNLLVKMNQLKRLKLLDFEINKFLKTISNQTIVLTRRDEP